MLSVKNLTKVYHSKKSDDVLALKNINLDFNEKGMVFILGKSGSGKSTLLNVLGGLDKFDYGEIIIKGRSSKEFKEKDFDSYRNTYLGFIFQEYNILPEFTVYKNIELALELQGKKATKEEVENLLKQVDLEGFSKRKPNELSGGQKQKVAIARALVKNPEIIMADEPTGALDSNTGRQVFDTLKQLSKEKLVLVVSHDRDFAEEYADRIIEMKDGEVISDKTKRLSAPEEVKQGFKKVSKDLIHIEKGYEFKNEDINKIKEFLNNSEGDIVLSSDPSLNKNFKKLARIDDDGNKEYFSETQKEDISTNSQKEFKLIKSRLKYKDSLKMGASGLKTKKVRLFFTILLTTIALALFGLSDTIASFDVRKSNYESLTSLGVSQIEINSRNIVSYSSYNYAVEGNVDETDLLTLQEKFPDFDFTPVYDYSYDLSNLTSINDHLYYYNLTSLSGIVFLDEEGFSINNIEFYSEGSVTGSVPSKGQVVISYYHYEMLKEFGLKTSTGGTITINSLSDIIGQTITINNEEYKIVGVFNLNFDSSDYTQLKDISTYSSELYSKMYEFQNKLSSGFNNVFIFNEADKDVKSSKCV